MKTKIHSLLIGLVMAASLHQAIAQTYSSSSTFTYQGLLNDGTNPANGKYDFQFQVYDAATAGTSSGSPNTNTITDVGITNGLFTVALDFGSSVFTGPSRWLQIFVRTNGNSTYTSLTNRQPLTATPYAIYAANAATLGGQASTAYVAKAGDTMTGTLNLPANGLAVGGSQLVSSAGNVGIGTTSPGAKLHIYGNAAPGPHIPSTEAILASGDGFHNSFMSVYGDNAVTLDMWNGLYGEVSTYNYTSGIGLPLVFNSNGGNVGIGTTSPQNQLEVQLAHASTNSSVATAAVKGMFSPSGAFGALAYTSTNPPNIINIVKKNQAKVQPNNTSTSTITYGVYGYGANGDSAGFFNGDVTINGFETIFGNENIYGNTYIDSSLTIDEGNYSGNPLIINGSGNTTAGGPGFAIPHTEAVLTSGDGFHNGFMSTYANSAVTMDMFNGNYGEVSTYNYGSGTGLPLILNVNGGNVGIGTTSPTYLLTVNGTAGKPGGGSWSTYSDARLKDVGTNFTDGLAALKDIQPVYYHYKTNNVLKLSATAEYVGVIAQQVKRAIPEAVIEGKDGYLSVNNDPVIWAMLNAIKELKSQNDNLEQRLDHLEKKK